MQSYNLTPPRLAHFHQVNGLLTITAMVIGINSSRRVRPNEINLLIKKLMQKDKNQLEKYLFHFKHLHPIEYHKFIQKEYESLI